MRKVLVIIGLAIGAMAVAVGWQFAAAEIANDELHDDLRDVGAQNGVNSGLNSPKSDDEIRNEVITTAAEHGLRLQPEQITLQKHLNGFTVHYDIQVDYTTQINLLLSKFALHFTQTSAP